MVNKSSARHYHVFYACICRQKNGFNGLYKNFHREIYASIDGVINFILNPKIEIFDINLLGTSNGNGEPKKILVNLYQSFSFFWKNIGRVYVVVSSEGGNYREKLIEKSNLIDLLRNENFISISLLPPPAFLSTP